MDSKIGQTEKIHIYLTASLVGKVQKSHEISLIDMKTKCGIFIHIVPLAFGYKSLKCRIESSIIEAGLGSFGPLWIRNCLDLCSKVGQMNAG